MKKLDFVSDESKYLYKCLDCGGQIEEDQVPDSWNVLSLDSQRRKITIKLGALRSPRKNKDYKVEG